MKIVKDFITNSHRESILDWILNTTFASQGHNRKNSESISNELNGFTALYDFSKTELSKYIAEFHGEYIDEEPPQLLIDLKNQIAFSDEHAYVQVIVLNKNGKIIPHYDASVNGYINYKCNIVIDGPVNDIIYVNKVPNVVNKGDLYCFEASLYKHWLEPVDSRRVVLSFGYLVTCDSLGWDKDAPRMKLSNRIMNKVVK